MAEESRPEKNPLPRVVIELLIALLIDVTVKAYLHTLIPLLPYGWMAVFTHSAWKFLTSSKTQKFLRPAYSYGKGKNIVTSYLIVFILGGGIFIAAWFALGRALGKPSTEIEPKAKEAKNSSTPHETEEKSSEIPDLKLDIDRVVPLWGIKYPGQPVSGENEDMYIAVVGKIISRRNVQASAEYWEINVRFADGKSMMAELLVPPDPLVIQHPPNKPPEFIKGQDYWPRKLDMKAIPAYGNSYGFIFGRLKGITRKQFNTPGTEVLLCFKDSNGKRFCDALIGKSENKNRQKEAKAPAPQAAPVINVEPGGSFDGTCDTIISGNRTAINAGGKVVTHSEGINAPSPCSPSELKIGAIDFLLKAKNNPGWDRLAISVLGDQFDQQAVETFTSQPDYEKKVEFLKKLKESINP